MASNSFGTVFKMTTWGESHGKAIGVVIDGCPAGLEITEEEIRIELARRSPGKSPFTSPRQEADKAEILSGVFEGVTTGAPISILIPNQDADPTKYEPIKHLLRPGHANFTYLAKYGHFDHSGGGRSSGRETACRVAAGAIARKFLRKYGIAVVAYLSQVDHIKAKVEKDSPHHLHTLTYQSPLFCPDPEACVSIASLIEQVQKEGDSLGGVVGFLAAGLPAGLGDPIYEKVEAKLASAMLSIPASKGFEIGSGFEAAAMRGSEHNDLFTSLDDQIQTKTNHAGGVLGGITSGMPLWGRVAFKPPSSIQKPQETLETSGKPATLQLPEGSRHDPCLAIRAVPVVEAMMALVLADLLLMNRAAKI